MPVNENAPPMPVYMPRTEGNYWVSTVVSTDASLSSAAPLSGTTVNVRGLYNVTAYVDRGVSTGSVELEASPDGTTWYNWNTFNTGAIPAAGEFVSQETFVSGGAFGYVRGLSNPSGTATSPVVVRLVGLTK